MELPYSVLLIYLDNMHSNPPVFKQIIKRGAAALSTISQLCLAVIIVGVVIILFFSFFEENKRDLAFLMVDKEPNIKALVLEDKNRIEAKIAKVSTQQAQLLGSMYLTLNCNILEIDCREEGVEPYYLGLISSLSKGISLPYVYQPASGGVWLAHSLSNVGLAPQVHADSGIGFNTLLPLLPIWKVFRDLAMLILTLIFIFLGFLILFRVKLNGKTEVTIMNSLPKIAIAMLLINFSYAIAGFMIDLMYIVMGLTLSFFSSTSLASIKDSVNNAIYFSSIGSLYDQVFASKTNQAHQIAETILSLIPTSLRIILTTVLSVIGATYLWSTVNLYSMPIKLAAAAAGATPFVNIQDFIKLGAFVAVLAFFLSFPGFILSILLILGFLIIFVRLLFILIGTFVEIIISVVLAPITLLAEAIPGSSAFIPWMRNLIGNLLVFPLVLLVLVFARIFSNLDFNSASLWAPPLLGFTTDNLSGMAGLISLVAIASIPNYIQNLKKSLGVKPSFSGSAAALGLLFAPGFRVLSAISTPFRQGAGEFLTMARENSLNGLYGARESKIIRFATGLVKGEKLVVGKDNDNKTRVMFEGEKQFYEKRKDRETTLEALTDVVHNRVPGKEDK